MNMLSKFFLITVAAAGLAVSASANAVLEIFDNSGSTFVYDNGSGDLNSAASAVLWTGTFNGWNISLAGGLTVQGGASPIIDLSGQITSVGTHVGGDTLKIFYGDSGFGPSSSSSLQGIITGTTGADTSIWFAGGYNASDISTGGAVAASTSIASSPFSATIYGSIPDAATYALMEQVEITNAGNGSFTSFDAKVSVPDSASTALLIGLGLLGVGVASRRKKTS